jgi:DNA-binding NarL/FixJ family response regulator
VPDQARQTAAVDLPPVAQSSEAIRVLVVDDHALFRRGLEMVLGQETDIEVIGEAGDGAEAVAKAADLAPQVVLLDVQLPDTDGFAVAAQLTGREDGPVVVLTSSRDGADFGPLIERSGARGFIPKAELSGERLRALVG